MPRAGRPALLGALGLLALYLAAVPGHGYSIDGFLMFEQGRSLALDHSLRFAAAVEWQGDYWTSKYGLGQSLLYAPLIWAWTWAGQHLGAVPTYRPDLHQDALFDALGAPVEAAVTAVTGWFVFRLAAQAAGSLRAGWWALLFFGVGSPALTYARGDWAQPLSGLCWTAALWAAVQVRTRMTPARAAVLAVAVAYGILTRPTEGLLAAGAAAFLARRSRRGLAVVAVAIVAGLAVTAGVNWARFGSPLTTGYAEGWSTPPWIGIPGALLSPARGLLWEFPALLLAPLGWRVLRRRGEGDLALALAGGALLQLLNTALWLYWWGGYDWGLRIFLPALPALAVLAGGGVLALRGAIAGLLPAALLAAGLLFALPTIVVDLNAGYGALADGTARSWRPEAYPPLGAWQFLRDSGVDVLWVRLAHHSELVLLAPLALLALAGALLAGAQEGGLRASAE